MGQDIICECGMHTLPVDMRFVYDHAYTYARGVADHDTSDAYAREIVTLVTATQCHGYVSHDRHYPKWERVHCDAYGSLRATL